MTDIPLDGPSQDPPSPQTGRLAGGCVSNRPVLTGDGRRNTLPAGEITPLPCGPFHLTASGMLRRGDIALNGVSDFFAHILHAVQSLPYLLGCPVAV